MAGKGRVGAQQFFGKKKSFLDIGEGKSVHKLPSWVF